MPQSDPNKSVDPLIRQVARTARRYAMFAPGDKVLVGVSGGPDSIALLNILYRLAPGFEIRLGVGYLNHGLRPAAAEQEARFVQATAHALGLAAHLDQVALTDGKGGLEERARNARYLFYRNTAQTHGYAKIALGHHAEDNAESVLMRLLRGSAGRGLAGIPPVRPDGIVRPLIETRKADILAYLEQHGIASMTDASNSDERFIRNKIRHQLLPLLEREYNPNCIGMLNRMAHHFREEEQWLESRIAPLVARATRHQDSRCLELHRDFLESRPRPVQRRLIRDALRAWRGNVRGLQADHVEALINLAANRSHTRSLNLPMGLKAEQTPQVLRFVHEPSPRPSPDAATVKGYLYSIDAPADHPLSVAIVEAGCRLTFSIGLPPEPAQRAAPESRLILLDLELLAFPLQVRSFQAGDRIQPFGMQGTQKLQDLFVNRKIPPRARLSLPLLISGGKIIWVVGIRRSAQAPLRPDTSQVLRVAVKWDQGHPTGILPAYMADPTA